MPAVKKAIAPRAKPGREQILDEAVHLFAQHGYADTDLQELADVVGVGKGTLYRHFGSKQDLFLAAADRVMQALHEHLSASIADVADPLDRIKRGIHAYLAHFDSHPESVEMLIQERAQFRDRKRPTFYEYREKNTERWRAIYRDLIAHGRVRHIPVERISNVVGDLLYGTMFVSYLAGRKRPPEAVAEEIIDIILHGILSDDERPHPPKP